jgi:LacI family transcriptional regulator
VAVLAPRTKLPGDTEGLRGFREGIDRATPPDIRLECLTHSGDRDAIGFVLNHAMARRERPTALLVFGSLSYLSAASHLARRGMSIGSDVSLICRDYDPFLDEMLPTVAHYRRDTTRFRKQMLAAIRDALEDAPGPRGARRVMAEFHPGESLGARP